MTKAKVTREQSDYDDHTVVLSRVFESEQEADRFLREKKESAEFIGKHYEFASKEVIE